MTARFQNVVVEQFVKAPVEQVFLAFTNATALRAWLCDLATVAPRPNGRIYLWWHGDFYSSGEYKEVKPRRSVTFTWHARFEDRPTTIKVTFTKKAGGVLVKLVHRVPVNKIWQGRPDSFKQEWIVSLENLRSVLEDGIDLRTANRPMLGIQLSDFNAEIAARMGVPVSQGIRLDGVVEGLGAHKAGLQKEDVIISIDSQPMTEFYASLVAALQAKKAGDSIEVVYYRAAEKRTVTLTLTGRPRPQVPESPAALAEEVNQRYAKSFRLLAACFVGVTEEEAGRRPAPQDWSAKEVLAHLIHSERYGQFDLVDSISTYERWSDDWTGNLALQVKATVCAFPTVPLLLDELKRLQDETIALLLNLPADFIARKHSYTSQAFVLLEGHTHIEGHCAQIRAALVAAKK